LPTLIHETSVEAARSILHTGLISGSDYGRKSHSASYPHFYIQGEAFQQKIFSRQTDAISLFFESDLPVSVIKLQARRAETTSRDPLSGSTGRIVICRTRLL
jgi:hypothetical protein